MGLDILCEMKLLWLVVGAGMLGAATAQGPPCTCAGGCGNDGITSANGGEVNVAYGKSASMSGNGYNGAKGRAGPACVAVNGRTSAVYRTLRESNTNCIHSSVGDYQPWWQVNLGQSYTVTKLTIYRRQDHAKRMADIDVLVDNTVCYSFPSNSDDNALRALPEKIDIWCNRPLTGQVVKLEKRTWYNYDNYYMLNICEVQVWGTSCTCDGGCGNDGTISANGREVNVAYGKSASMSGNGYSDIQVRAGPACVAVNGRMSAVYRTLRESNTNCIHSSYENYRPWWQVNLGQIYTVRKLTIYRRQGFTKSMANIDVFVDNTVCYRFPSSSDDSALDALPEKIDISCNQPLTGQVVKLEKRTRNNDSDYYFLNICEVQVWVCAHGYYGNNCENNCGRCKNGDTCDAETGMCPDGCQPGWRNQDCQTGPPCTCAGGCGNNGITSADGREVNVANGKSASMSGYGHSDNQGRAGHACMAVNGRTSVVYRTLSESGTNCIHSSEGDYQPRWQVNLGQTYTVRKLTIYRRQGFAKRMANIDVLVDNTVCYRFPSSSDNSALNALPEKIDISCNQPLTGQVVKLEKRTWNTHIDYYFLNICEVQVWGPPCTCDGGCGNSGITSANGQEVNVAYGRSASMSGDYSNGQGQAGPACVAVNGRTSVVYRTLRESGTNCVHSSEGDNQPWWQVNLGQTYTIRKLTIYRRQGFARRMADIDVLVDDTVCYSFPSSSEKNALDALPDKIDISCNQRLMGQVVKLKKRPRKSVDYHYFLNICEVQVWVCAHGYYGNSCQNSCGRCRNGITCNSETGVCPDGCQPGWRNQKCQTGPPCTCAGGCGNNGVTSADGREVNIAYGKSTSMSGHGFNGAQGRAGPACMAVNGRTSVVYRTLRESDTNCIHSSIDDYQPWWQVNLGQSYTITKLTIYRRQDSARRMANIDVLVDNTVCYRFPSSSDNSALDALPEKIHISCNQPLTGQVVKLEKRTWNTHAFYYFLNICEVQVWVCAHGYYGNSCQNSCGRCKKDNTCNAETGVCPNGCQPGWRNQDCQTECEDGTYGDGCSSTCGNCSVVCNKKDGTCPGDCQPGFDQPDQLCKTLCRNGTFGSGCSQNCSETCGGSGSCDPVSGQCKEGCKAGFIPGDNGMCRTVCADGTYGINCKSDCGNCNGICNKISGFCSGGCRSGFDPSDSFCKEPCKNGTFGDACSQNCSETCGGSGDCDSVSGRCVQGCNEGFTSGDDGMCRQRDDSYVYIIVGAVGVGIVIAIAVGAAILIMRWRRKKEALAVGSRVASECTDTVDARNRSQETVSSFDPISQESAKSVVKQKARNKRPQGESSRVHYNVENTSVTMQHPPSFSSAAASESAANPLSLPNISPKPAGTSMCSNRPQTSHPNLYEGVDSPDDFHLYSFIEENKAYASFKATQSELDTVKKYLVDRLASGELSDEFSRVEKVKKGLAQKTAVMPINLKKNRFATILPYDQNRVILKDGYNKDGATNFVSASYLSGYHSAKQYIASQGPRYNTVIDFWRMIWQERIPAIVMLANLHEDAKNKCYLYWPEEEGGKEIYGPVSVTTTRVECRDSFCIRTLTIQKRQKSRQVTQYHYLSWPGHGVPTTTSLVSFWRYITTKTRLSGDMDSSPPLLVHCSSGVGRTGIYIGLDIGLDTAVSEGSVNVFDLVQRLCAERCLMVQAPDQYLFLHKVLLEAYFAHGTNISLDHFPRVYPKQICSARSTSRIDEEFQSLMHLLSLTPEHRHDSAMQKENITKNRNPDVLPSEDHLISLTEREAGRNQYINAIFMPTFQDAKGSVVTQLPLPSTLIDFWRLVYGSDVTTIVSLSSPDEKKELKDYIQYWPPDEGRTLQSGPYKITLSSKSQHAGSGLTTYGLSLVKKGVSKPRTIQLLHYKGWTGEVGGKVADMLHLIDTLVTTHDVSETSRLLVQCSDGVGKSGLFCALCNIINHMTHDEEIDVFMTVRHIQTISPKAVSSVVQYRYCYEVAQSHIQEMHIYCNA